VPGESFRAFGAAFEWAAAGTDRVGGAIPLLRESGPDRWAGVSWAAPSQLGFPSFASTPDGYFYDFEGVARFHVATDGSCAHVYEAAGADPTLFRQVLLRGILPRLLHLRGQPCLHASAVMAEGGVVGFLGPSGAGKSTVAAALSNAGHPLVTDDVLPIRIDGDVVAAGPGLLELRLHAASATMVGIEPQVAASSPRSAKVTWTPPRRSEGGPLGALFLLAPREDAPVEAERIRGVEALLTLAAHSFWLDPSNTSPLRAEIDQFAVVAERVPLCRLRYSLSTERLEEIDTLVQQLLHSASTSSGL
jgi:energy-coupling factor transporter ATP-binding protein EcfA2